VTRVLERVRERGIEVTLTDAARELLGNMGYDPAYGARARCGALFRSSSPTVLRWRCSTANSAQAMWFTSTQSTGSSRSNRRLCR
jgi:hypothetical protein